MVSPGCSASATPTSESTSFKSAGTHRAISAMPPLPGAHTISVTFPLRLTAQASACSRPPEPKINTFMGAFPALVSLDGSGVHLDTERLSEQTGGRKSNPPHRNVQHRCSPILIRDGRALHRAGLQGRADW